MTRHLAKLSPFPGLRASSRQGALLARAYGLGILFSASLMVAALHTWVRPGVVTPPSLSTMRFTVAMLAGPKQAAQTAPQDVENVAEAVASPPEPVKSAPVVAAKRETSLPEARKAAQSASPGPQAAAPVQVLPPARVAMPGGKLMVEDAPMGDGADDPFAIKPQQVYIRLLVDKSGRVTRSGIVRSGGDQLRDGLILKAMTSRTYSTDTLLRVGKSDPPTWQVDMVIDYGTNDLLP